MTIPLRSQIDAENRIPFINVAPGTAAGHVVTFEQLAAAIEGIAWKDAARVASTANVTISAPGAAIDGITLANGDRVLLKNQTSVPENGIYIFNGAAVSMTRALDASTFAEIEGAVVMIEEGTSNAGTAWRQTQVNGTIDTNNNVWTAFGTAAPAATEGTPGILELATQAETDTGADDARAVTPLKLANWSLRAKRYSTDIGDAAATSIVVTHNLNTLDCEVYVRETGGSKRQVMVEVQHTSVNSVTLIFAAAPALNSHRVTVLA